MADEDRIIAEAVAYTRSFVERPNPSFNNLPVCPFAKKARIEGKLKYMVFELTVDRALEEVSKWDPESHTALILLDPRKDLNIEVFEEMTREASSRLPGGLSLFDSHPASDFLFRGVLVRREPYPNWQVMRLADLELAQSQLSHSRWYSKEATDGGRDAKHRPG